MNYKKIIIATSLFTLLNANLQALELSNRYNSFGLDYVFSTGDVKSKGFGLGVNFMLPESQFLVGLQYGKVNYDEINGYNLRGADFDAEAYGIALGYAFSINETCDLIPSVGYANLELDSKLFPSDIDLNTWNIDLNCRFKVSEASIISIRASYFEKLEDFNATDWDLGFALAYEHGLNENLFLDAGVTTSEFDTYIFNVGVNWSWGI